jgi:hypothetical protein
MSGFNLLSISVELSFVDIYDWTHITWCFMYGFFHVEYGIWGLSML